MGWYRFYWLVFVCLGGIVLSITCSCDQITDKPARKEKSTQEEPQVIKGGIYRASLLNNPTTLDPAYVQDQYGTTVVQQLFDGLVRFDPYLLVLPALAKTWQIEDNGKTYRFHLQDNALFHNGDPVTADDVVFSLSRLLRVEPAPAIVPHLLKISGARAYQERQSEVVAGLQALDKKTVSIQLEEPYAPFLTALGMYQAKIVPKAEVLRSGEAFGRKPVGSGPFEFVSWEMDKHIQLKRFTGYFAENAYLDGVEYAIYPGVAIKSLLADFSVGALDEMPVMGRTREELAQQKDLQWFHRPVLGLMFYGINVNHPLLSNPEFRRKLSSTIDREELLSLVYNNQLEPAYNILPPGMPGVNREKKELTKSLAIGETTHNNKQENQNEFPLSLEIVSGSQSAFAQSELQFIRESWATLGVNLHIKYLNDWSRFEEYINSDHVQIYRYAWFADMPDPDSFLYPLFASTSSSNFTGFHNEKVDHLLLSAQGENNGLERARMYREIEYLIMEMTPIIPLLYPSIDRVYQPDVHGAQPSALGADYMSLHHVWLKKTTPAN